LLVVPGLLAAAGALYALRVVGGLPGVPAGAQEPERLLRVMRRGATMREELDVTI
jgi:hypothetical protein